MRAITLHEFPNGLEIEQEAYSTAPEDAHCIFIQDPEAARVIIESLNRYLEAFNERTD